MVREGASSAERASRDAPASPQDALERARLAEKLALHASPPSGYGAGYGSGGPGGGRGGAVGGPSPPAASEWRTVEPKMKRCVAREPLWPQRLRPSEGHGPLASPARSRLCPAFSPSLRRRTSGRAHDGYEWDGHPTAEEMFGIK